MSKARTSDRKSHKIIEVMDFDQMLDTLLHTIGIQPPRVKA